LALRLNLMDGDELGCQSAPITSEDVPCRGDDDAQQHRWQLPGGIDTDRVKEEPVHTRFALRD